MAAPAIVSSCAVVGCGVSLPAVAGAGGGGGGRGPLGGASVAQADEGLIGGTDTEGGQRRRGGLDRKRAAGDRCAEVVVGDFGGADAVLVEDPLLIRIGDPGAVPCCRCRSLGGRRFGLGARWLGGLLACHVGCVGVRHPPPPPLPTGICVWRQGRRRRSPPSGWFRATARREWRVLAYEWARPSSATTAGALR